MPSDNNCGKCKKELPLRIRIIKCDSCKTFFHVKCCGINHKIYKSIKQRGDTWHCKACTNSGCNVEIISPDNVDDNGNIANPNAINIQNATIKKKSKCGKCQKNMPPHLQVINCITCRKYFHVKCSGTSKQSFLKLNSNGDFWTCYNCVSKLMPFSQIDNNELFLESQNKTQLFNDAPSFTIQSLLDKMPGQNFETDEFMSESISSKYFTPSEFLQSKIDPKKFSIVHINIASLSKHIDELRNLVHALEHPFDIIGITETRLHENDPLVNINIDGYEFRHTPTSTQCGGAGIYVKTGYEFDVINELSQSINNVSESFFIELKRSGRKNIIMGCVYRHHTPIPTFIDGYLKKTLEKISKQLNKICALMGDFNVDLVKYAVETNSADFYDLLSSHSFRPLILQPTRITLKSKTLIDNIFINDLTCHSFGGNLTSSISDHYLQFSITDLFQTPGLKKKSKFARDFRHFNKREFREELENIDWSNVIDDTCCTDSSYNAFYKKIENILDYMAPYRKLSLKEMKLEQMPWVTSGILVSMGVRDKLHKSWNNEKDAHIKA